MDRRSFLKRTAITAAASVPLTAFASRLEAGEQRPTTHDYGDLNPVIDETTGLPLLALPAGFRYLSFGWTNDPMTNGNPTPGSHDGMAAYDAGDGKVWLVRNHERGGGAPFSSVRYNPAAAGGTTTVLFDGASGEYVSTVDSLSGTIRNCAGGPTPWGSWLTCEETTEFRSGMPHGYVFDVPGDGSHGNPVPIKDMGRFSHEALAVDPETGYVYLTEDAGTSSGFYRFVPSVSGELGRGGRLDMLRVAGSDPAGANLYTGYANKTRWDVEWVEIGTPDSNASNMPGNFVFGQGRVQGGAAFGRLEGAWYGKHGLSKIYFVSTNGGAAGQGQIFEYTPQQERLELVFESPDAATLNAPDNITVSPRGGLVLCEDGSGIEYVHGLTVNGRIFPFVRNNMIMNGEKGFAGNFTGNEFAGACYSPDGTWLFVNVQSPGVTYAITGPWHKGAL
jgi:secreted PhoX family phosphatase